MHKMQNNILDLNGNLIEISIPTYAELILEIYFRMIPLPPKLLLKRLTLEQ